MEVGRGGETSPLVPAAPSGLNHPPARTSILLTPAPRARAKGSRKSVDLRHHQASWPKMSIALRAQSSSRNISSHNATHGRYSACP